MSEVKMKNQKRIFRKMSENSEPSSSHQSKKFKPDTVKTIVFCNDVIIGNILAHVSVRDLMNCRLVNSHWTPIATARLIKLKMQCNSFQYHYIRKCYLAGTGQLSEFIKCAVNSARFPSTSFTFRAGDMCSDDAEEFLAVMGSTVKTLTLFAVNNWTLCRNMDLTHILSHTPNLETLIFQGGSYYDFTATRPLMLPSLKTIKISCQLHIHATGFELILNAAPNLKNFVGVWRLDDLKPIFATDKVHTVKEWCPNKFSFPSGLIQLATATEDKLKLNELVLFMGDNDHPLYEDGIDPELLWKCFLKTLNTNTVHKLILNCSEYPPNASFPLNMDNVEELVLMPHSDPQALTHFPFDINLNSTFPRVKTLSFYDPLYHVCCSGSGADWKQCFPLSPTFGDFNEILSTVTTLNLRLGSTSLQMLQKLRKICPNVQNLEICLNEKLDKTKIVKELCGKWRNLKKLSIDLTHRNLELLDSAFTGLSAKYLERLNGDRSLTDEEKLKKADDKRSVLWIGNISGLTRLDIKYDLSYQSKGQTLIPFTKSSGLYAFNLMPNLSVNVRYHCHTETDEMKTALHSIRLYATINRY